jgi:hypothetical protein
MNTPPWRVVRQRGQDDWSHCSASNRRLGFNFGSAVLTGLLAEPVRLSVGLRGRTVLVGAAPACAGPSWTALL